MSNTTQAAQDIEIGSAIAAFEKILEAVPNDRLAIETLADAFDRLGDQDKASTYFLRLVEVVIAENDTASGPSLIQRLESFGKMESMVQARRRVEQMLAKDAAARLAAEKAPSSIRKSVDITNEVALAWELLQANRLTQADYASVVQDLSENSSKRIDVPVSVLHALADRQFKGLDKVVAHISKISGRPAISLSSFELNAESFMLLPMEFMTRRGAIVFDLMGHDALIAVLNPIDKDLEADVQRMLKRKCHFYVSAASDYDNALATIRKYVVSRDESA